MKEAVTGKIDLRGGVRKEAFACVLAFLYTDSLVFAVPTTTAGQARQGDGCGELLLEEEASEGGGAGFVVVDEVLADPAPELVMEVCFLASQYTLVRLVALCEGLLVRLAHKGGPQSAAALYSFADLVSLDNLKAAVKSVVFRSAQAWQEFVSSLKPELRSLPSSSSPPSSSLQKKGGNLGADKDLSEISGAGDYDDGDDGSGCVLSASLVSELQRERTTTKHLYCGFHADHTLKDSLFKPPNPVGGEGKEAGSSPRWMSAPGSELMRRLWRGGNQRTGGGGGGGGGAEEGSVGQGEVSDEEDTDSLNEGDE
jgi:hypothetical protein